MTANTEFDPERQRIINDLEIDAPSDQKIKALLATGLPSQALATALSATSEEVLAWGEGSSIDSQRHQDSLEDMRYAVRELMVEGGLTPEEVVNLITAPLHDTRKGVKPRRSGESFVEIIASDPEDAAMRTEWYLAFGSLALHPR